MSPAALARTGSAYDGWLPYPPDPDDYAAGLATVRAAAGRPGAPVAAGLFATVRIDDDAAAARRALDAYTRAVYGLPHEQACTIQAMTAGPAEHVAAHLTRFVAAGAEHLVVRLAAPDLAGQRDQLERLTAMAPQLAFSFT